MWQNTNRKLIIDNVYAIITFVLYTKFNKRTIRLVKWATFGLLTDSKSS